MKRTAIKVKETRKCAWKECGVTFKKAYGLQQCCCAEHDRRFRESKGRKDDRSNIGNGDGLLLQGVRHPRRYQVPKVSTSQAKKNYLIAKNKEKRLNELGWEICECCEKPTDTDLAHIIPKSIRPDLYTEYENNFLGCRRCHDAWDSQEVFTVRKFRNLVKLLDYVERNDTKRFLFLMEKFNNQIQYSK